MTGLGACSYVQLADKVGTGPGFPASADVWTASPAVSGIPASRGCAVALLRILVADIKVVLAFLCHLAGGLNISGMSFSFCSCMTLLSSLGDTWKAVCTGLLGLDIDGYLFVCFGRHIGSFLAAWISGSG